MDNPADAVACADFHRETRRGRDQVEVERLRQKLHAMAEAAADRLGAAHQAITSALPARLRRRLQGVSR